MRCWTCGTEYQGHACPVCSIKREVEKGADRIAGAQRDAAEMQHRDAEALREALAAQAEEQAWRMEAAAAQATEDQRRNIADSFRLQSVANNERAVELLSAGLLDEALHHAEQAILLDRGNLHAHLTAAGILWTQDKLELARTRLGKAVHLLRTVDYRDRPDWFLAVLRCLPAQANLYGELVSALQQTASRWKYSAEVAELIFALDEARLHSASVGLTETLISCAPRLQLYACLLAVSPATSAENERRLRTFLDQFKDNRALLVDQVRAVKSMEVVPTAVRDEVMRLVQFTYRAWGPYVEEQTAAVMERSGQAAAAKPQESRAGTGWLVGIVIWIGGSLLVGAMAEALLGQRAANDAASGILVIFMFLGIVAGVATAKLLKARDHDRRVARAREEALEKALEVERQVANGLGLTDLFSGSSGMSRAAAMSAVADAAVDTYPTTKCPSCGTPVYTTAKICASCWKPLR